MYSFTKDTNHDLHSKSKQYSEELARLHHLEGVLPLFHPPASTYLYHSHMSITLAALVNRQFGGVLLYILSPRHLTYQY